MTNIDFDSELREAVGQGDRFTVPEQWQGLPGIAFGGFVAAGMFWAASQKVDGLRPLSIHARFHAPVPLRRAVQLTAVPVREGRNIAIYDTSLSDGGKLLTTASVAFGKNTTADFELQTAAPMRPLSHPVPIYKVLEEAGAAPERITPMMRRVGHRRNPELPDPRTNGGFHLENDWPASSSANPATRAAVVIMCTDAFSLPATVAAINLQPEKAWPVVMRSLDLTTWFHNLGAGAQESAPARFCVRTTVSVAHGGYALSRCEVWHGDRLAAEAMSHVTLQPVQSQS